MTATSLSGRRGVGISPRLRTLLVVVVTSIGILGLSWAINNPTADGLTEIDINVGPGAAPAVGAPPPDFAAVTIDGESFRLDDFAGRPVWLTFGASWCADCRAEAVDLQATYEAFRADGLVIVGVFIQEDAAAVREYAGRVGFDFTMTADPRAEIAAAYRTLGIPTHYFIGADGLIRQVRIGALDRDDMERLVRELIG